MKALTKSELREGLVARRPEDHKGVYGHALIIAGSRGMPGAAILAARAALRSGAGLVTVAIPVGTAPVVAGAVPAAMILALPENGSGVFLPSGIVKLKTYAKERRVTACALGPGITTHPDAARFVFQVLAGVPVATLIDADALNALASQGFTEVARTLKARRSPCIVTPHPGEIARLLKIEKPTSESDRVSAVERLAREGGVVALLKGRRTLISTGTRTVVNPTGGPGLAKGGSGDALTGLITGLWAQALASGRVTGDIGFKCAALGAWLHGTAGDAAESELTAWATTATDLIEFLSHAFKAL